jgi:hypothetical protein
MNKRFLLSFNELETTKCSLNLGVIIADNVVAKLPGRNPELWNDHEEWEKYTETKQYKVFCWFEEREWRVTLPFHVKNRKGRRGITNFRHYTGLYIVPRVSKIYEVETPPNSEKKVLKFSFGKENKRKGYYTFEGVIPRFFKNNFGVHAVI